MIGSTVTVLRLEDPMELVIIIVYLGTLAMMFTITAGVWATYWAVMRGFQQMIVGLQSLDGRLTELNRK